MNLSKDLLDPMHKRGLEREKNWIVVYGGGSGAEASEEVEGDADKRQRKSH